MNRPSTSASPSPMPVGFVGHGIPLLALEKEGAAASWRAWGESLPRPRAIVVVSAHWLKSPPVVGAGKPLPLIYDFYGFPDPLYKVRYPAGGTPELAREVEALLAGAGLSPHGDPERGLDHGAWVPLLHMFPDARVPVLQVSVGWGAPPEEYLALGRALAPLRSDGVFLLGSGNVVHNLRLADLESREARADSWAEEFDAWCAAAIETSDLDSLADYSARAPGARLAVATDDHYSPFLVAMAAALEGGGRPKVRYPHTGFEYRNLSMRAVEWG